MNSKKHSNKMQKAKNKIKQTVVVIVVQISFHAEFALIQLMNQ